MIDTLRTGNAADFDFVAYQQASEAAKQERVNQYIMARIKDAPELKAAEDALMREAKVVPVALNLGVVLLQRAQGMTDPAAPGRAGEGREDVPVGPPPGWGVGRLPPQPRPGRLLARQARGGAEALR